MNQINTIHINNFKFFGDSEPIQLNGKHLLLYGENGSGKSSLFWALYTLLESINKSDEKLVQYFTQGDDAGLVNIYAQQVSAGDWNSFVSLTLKDGSAYRIAVDDFSTKSRPYAQATQRGSDFLNYRFMFKLHDFRHKDEIDLFALFQKEVFPYVNTRDTFIIGEGDSVRPSQDFGEIWDDLWASIPQPRTRQVKNSDYNKTKQEYARRVTTFADELNRLLADVNGYGNQVLQQELGYAQIRFQVNCPLVYAKNSRGKENPDEPILPLRITLTIPEYDGLVNVINRPQSFLNEAKLTAIGIAIRLAIIQRRADYARKADFQLLVLDDLLISLDMSNRRKVLDLLLTQYAPTYQLFILTHDRSFFQFAEKKIRVENGQKETWEFVEMYEDNSQSIPRPYIAKKKANLKRAEDYFKEHDYPACGLYLRRDCEKLLGELLPDKFKFVIDQDGQTEGKDLNGLINSLEEFCTYEEIDYSPFRSLKIYKDVILNTLAHNDAESPLYQQEIRAVLDAIRQLDTIKRGRVVIGSGKDLTFQLINIDGIGITVSLRTREGFVLVEEQDRPVRLSNFGKCEVRSVNRGAGWIAAEQGYNDIKELVDFYKQELSVTDSFDMLDFLKYRDQSLRSKLTPAANPE